MDPEQSCAVLIHDTARLIRRRFDHAIRDLGLTEAKWRVLAALSRQPGLTQSELAERLEIEKAPLGLALGWLQQAGWIRRAVDPSDRRARRVHLEERAAPTLTVMEQRFRELEARYLRGFDEPEVADLLASLQVVRAQLRQPAGPRITTRTDAPADTYISVLFECARLLIRRFDSRLAEQGFTRQQWLVLNSIERREGLRQGALTELTDLGAAAIGKLVDALQSAGWIERRVDPEDRRAHQLFLTRRGRHMLASARERFETLHASLEHGLEPARYRSLVSRLGWIRQRLLEEAVHIAEARRAGVR